MRKMDRRKRDPRFTTERVIERISETRDLNAAVDNAPVLANLTRGIIVTIQISDNEVNLVDAKVALVPKKRPREALEGCLLVKGMKEGNEVIVTGVPDNEWIAKENVGLVRCPVREIMFALPLEAPIDTLIVQVKPELPSTELDVRKPFEEFCKRYPDDEFCREDE